MFVACYGDIYEASPWVAETAWDVAQGEGLDQHHFVAAALHQAVEAAPRAAKLALIRAHPELASRARMADASAQEQSDAGLDQCSPQEFAAFQRLNAAYNARFGFPFVVAVRGMTRGDILATFEARLANDAETEFAEALRQIHKIARLRLEELD
jgi:2-oxo-4-hydroxy-4-carboxy-5-ureidoimidazoline decarboxylase